MLITPTTWFSLSIGTATNVLTPPSSTPATTIGVAVEVGLFRTQVSDMDRLPGANSTGNDESRARTEHSSTPPNRRVCVWYRTVDRNKADGVAFAEKQVAVACLAEPRRVGEDSIEYGLEVCWRTADDAKDSGSRRLPLQRFAQLAGGRRLPLQSLAQLPPNSSRILQIRIGFFQPSRHIGQEPRHMPAEPLSAHFWCRVSRRALTPRVAHSITSSAVS